MRKSIRNLVLDRDGERCVYCGKGQRGPTFQDPAPIRLTLDHVLPRSLGGPSRLANLVTCCNHCNNTRGDMDIVEWLSLLNPRESVEGWRAVTLVLQALRSDARTPLVEATLQRLLETFEYV